MINLWERNIPGFNPDISPEIPSITPYVLDDGRLHSAVIVCPGGGYEMRADHEGEPVAKWLNSIGISSFVLNYRVHPYMHPYPSMDAKRAIRLVRYNASMWNIDSSKIGILGFSAGGHLAATTGTYFEEDGLIEGDPVDRCSSKPNAMVLCYPVITTGALTHGGSIKNLLGESPDKNLLYRLSVENSVSSETPPSFIWTTANDESVPVQNSLSFAEALSRNNIPFELHIFPNGRHGLGMAPGVPGVEQWPDLCHEWFYSIGFLTK